MRTDISRVPLPIVRMGRGTWRLPHADADRQSWTRARARLLAPTEDMLPSCIETIDEALSDAVRSVVVRLDRECSPTALVKAIRQLGPHAEASEHGEPIAGRDAIASVVTVSKATEGVSASHSRPMSWLTLDFPGDASEAAREAIRHFAPNMAACLLTTPAGALRLFCATTEPSDQAITASFRSMRAAPTHPFAVGERADTIPTAAYPILSAVPKRYGLPGGISRGSAVAVRQRGSATHRRLAADTNDLMHRYDTRQDPTRLVLSSGFPFPDWVVEAAEAYVVRCGGPYGKLRKLLSDALRWHREALPTGADTPNR